MKTQVRPMDASVRERALNPSESFIVQAPAGSGKTELLIRRYLSLLAVVEYPEEVVAITFTRKAANEMRTRVLTALEVARGPRPGNERDQETWILGQKVLASDLAHGWNLAMNPVRLRVTTIDAFCAGLTRQMPVVSRLGSSVVVTENPTALYREAAQALLKRLESQEVLSGAIEALLRHLDNDLPYVVELIVAMLARRDQWMRHLGDGNGAPDRSKLEEALQHAQEEGLATLIKQIPENFVSEITALAQFSASNLIRAGSESPLVACLDMRTLPGTTREDMPYWLGLQALLIAPSSKAWRRRIDKTIGFPAPSQAKSPEDTVRFKEAKERFQELIAQLAAYHELEQRLVQISTLPCAHYSDAQWEVVEGLCILLPVAVAELWVIFSRQGVVDFTEMAWGALRALGRHDEPTDLALALDYRIRHILLDEFQDTSQTQYDLLMLLTAGWQVGDGRTLFLVGDPMQSIYRFRQAEVSLFLKTWKQGIGDVSLTPLTLSVNFRSQAGIVAWVNQVFAQTLPQQQDLTVGAVSYTPAIAHRLELDGPAVVIHPQLGIDHRLEAKRVVVLVQAALAEPDVKTIAVLVRSRNHLVDIAYCLREEGLSFRAVDIEPLGQRPLIQDLLSLTRAIVHPADQLSWWAILRAPWCGITLSDMEILADDNDYAVLSERVLDPKFCSRLSADGQVRVARVRSVMMECALQWRRYSLRRLVEGAWIELGGPACLIDKTDLANAVVYFDLLESAEEACDISDLASLAERVDVLFASVDIHASDQIQLMTMHKAKGLQFDVVIIPGLGRRPRSSGSLLLAWTERPLATGGMELLLAPIAEKGGGSEPISQYLQMIEKEKSHYEDGRLLYVATTRAICRLHLLGHVRLTNKQGAVVVGRPPEQTLLSILWDGIEGTYREALQDATQMGSVKEQESVSQTLPNLWRLPFDWKAPSLPADLLWPDGDRGCDERTLSPIEFSWVQSMARCVGIVVHRMLQQIGGDGIEQWDKPRIIRMRPVLRRQLYEQGVGEAYIKEALARTEKALINTLSDARGRWILDAGHSMSACEYGVTAWLQDTLVRVVFDRTFIDNNGIRWIIDYKTSTHGGGGLKTFLDEEESRYRSQLDRYAQAMRLMEDRPIHLGLYFPLLGAWRERVAEMK